jgi:hypothetical protein
MACTFLGQIKNHVEESMNTKTAAADSDHPKKWWQWFLLYPVFATSVIASIPTYINLIKSDDSQAKTHSAQSASTENNQQEKKLAKMEAQNKLWKANLQCSSAPESPVTTEKNYKVDATICNSTGDILVKVYPPKGEAYYRWVALDDIIGDATMQSSGTASWFISSAYAADMQLALNGTVICQRYVTQNQLLRRIQVAGQGCFDEVVDTYTGAVVSTTPSNCSAQC